MRDGECPNDFAAREVKEDVAEDQPVRRITRTWVRCQGTDGRERSMLYTHLLDGPETGRKEPNELVLYWDGALESRTGHTVFSRTEKEKLHMYEDIHSLLDKATLFLTNPVKVFFGSVHRSYRTRSMGHSPANRSSTSESEKISSMQPNMFVEFTPEFTPKSIVLRMGRPIRL